MQKLSRAVPLSRNLAVGSLVGYVSVIRDVDMWLCSSDPGLDWSFCMEGSLGDLGTWDLREWWEGVRVRVRVG